MINVMSLVNKYKNDMAFNIINQYLSQLMPSTTIQLLKDKTLLHQDEIPRVTSALRVSRLGF
jgi:hypothetical protein